MNISPWPQIFLPKLPEESLPLPRLSLKTSDGNQLFGNQDLRMYVCGITPYDSTHLGHAATYLTFDLISRYVRASGMGVSFVENITDIDEPLLERASRDGVPWQDLALNQVQLFQADMTALHVIPPQHFVPATSAMNLVDEAITAMKRNSFVYKVDDDLYFDISSFLIVFRHLLTKLYRYLPNGEEIQIARAKDILSTLFYGGLIKRGSQDGRAPMDSVGPVGTSNVV